MKKLEIISATQIELFRKCPRKWVERYIFQNTEPTTEPMKDGLEVHQAIEAFLKTGKVAEGRWKKVIEKVAATMVELDLA